MNILTKNLLFFHALKKVKSGLGKTEKSLYSLTQREKM